MWWLVLVVVSDFFFLPPFSLFSLSLSLVLLPPSKQFDIFEKGKEI